MSEQFKKRFDSFLWRGMMMLGALVVDFLLQSLGDFNMSTQMTVILGLVLGEVSKYLNSEKIALIS